MATFTQWRTSFDGGDLRRVTWICGDQRVLVEEVVDAIRRKLLVDDLDYVSLTYSSTFDRDVWAVANQYPLLPGVPRLILVRDAEKLNHRGQLVDWISRSRTLPNVYLVLVSAEPDFPYTTSGGKKTLKPYAAGIKAPRGIMVRCAMPNEKDAIAWIRRRAPLAVTAADHLLTRASGNLATAAAVAAKLSLFEGNASAATIDLLCLERPMDDFTDILLALDKRRALLRIPDLDEPDRFKLVALLDSRLDLLQSLHHHQNAGHTFREISGISPFLVRQYMPLARHYDPGRCTHRRRVLAVVDDAMRSGSRIGVLEALVALW